MVGQRIGYKFRKTIVWLFLKKKALQLYEELQRRKAMFYLPGETAMALNVAEQSYDLL